MNLNFLRDIKIVHLGLVDWLKRHGFKFVIGVFLVGVVLAAARNYFGPQKKTIIVGSKKIKVEIVKTTAGRAQGLSGRESLCSDCGMLLDFSQLDYHGIWMKEMKFDLDLLWIADGKIIGITGNVPYPSPGQINLPVYQPPFSVNAVLEVSSGWASRNGIKVGDMVKY